MGDIKVFRIDGDAVSELPGQSMAVEKSLQTLVERHLDTFLGVRFLASEHPTGPTHGGWIDTLGIDENGCRVTSEYKRALNAETNEDAWASLYSTTSRPFDPPETGRIAIKVINHYGDEVLKVYEVGASR